MNEVLVTNQTYNLTDLAAKLVRGANQIQRPPGAPPGLIPSSSIKPPPRAPPPVGLSQSLQRPIVDMQQRDRPSSTGDVEVGAQAKHPGPPKPFLAETTHKAGAISMFEEPDPSKSPVGEPKTRPSSGDPMSPDKKMKMPPMPAGFLPSRGPRGAPPRGGMMLSQR
jgi:hypothetical protein